MDVGQHGGRDPGGGEHHAVVGADVFRRVGQVEERALERVVFGLLVRVRVVLVQEGVVFLVLGQVVVLNALFLKQIPSELVVDVDLVVLVLNLAQFFQRDPVLNKHLVEGRPMQNNLLVASHIFHPQNELRQLLRTHNLNHWLDLRTGFLNQLLQLSFYQLWVRPSEVSRSHVLQMLGHSVHLAVRTQRTSFLVFQH